VKVHLWKLSNMRATRANSMPPAQLKRAQQKLRVRVVLLHNGCPQRPQSHGQTYGDVGHRWDIMLWILHFSGDEGPRNCGKCNCIPGGCRQWIEHTFWENVQVATTVNQEAFEEDKGIVEDEVCDITYSKNPKSKSSQSRP